MLTAGSSLRDPGCVKTHTLAKQTSICVVNETGIGHARGLVDSDPDAIVAFVRSPAPGMVRICLETGPTATWLWSEPKRGGCRRSVSTRVMQRRYSRCRPERGDSTTQPHVAERATAQYCSVVPAMCQFTAAHERITAAMAMAN